MERGAQDKVVKSLQKEILQGIPRNKRSWPAFPRCINVEMFCTNHPNLFKAIVRSLGERRDPSAINSACVKLHFEICHPGLTVNTAHMNALA
eukprot:1148161-Pelagomonas_calceolata.AAC.4